MTPSRGLSVGLGQPGAAGGTTSPLPRCHAPAAEAWGGLVVPFRPGFGACPLSGSAWPGGCFGRSFSVANWGQERGGNGARRHLGPQPCNFGAGSPPAHLEAAGGPHGGGVAGPHQVPAAQPLAQRLLQQVLEADGVHSRVLGQDEPLDGDDGDALPLVLGPQRLDDHVQGGGMRGPPAPGQRTRELGCASSFSCCERQEAALGTQPQPRGAHPQGLKSLPEAEQP